MHSQPVPFQSPSQFAWPGVVHTQRFWLQFACAPQYPVEHALQFVGEQAGEFSSQPFPQSPSLLSHCPTHRHFWLSLHTAFAPQYPAGHPPQLMGSQGACAASQPLSQLPSAFLKPASQTHPVAAHEACAPHEVPLQGGPASAPGPAPSPASGPSGNRLPPSRGPARQVGFGNCQEYCPLVFRVQYHTTFSQDCAMQ